VWAFWLLATRRSHPSLTLAVIVTTALVAAYATAAYVNHLALVPRLWRAGHRAG
jgi:ABC-type antimicrobial peptide transport system permease subunit